LTIIHEVGIVLKGNFFPLVHEDQNNPITVTETRMVEAATPTPMKLDDYEGKVIMIKGESAPGRIGKIYDAKIEEVASPILSVVAKRVANLQMGVRDHRDMGWKEEVG
jgi:hypothetical protein